MIRNFNLKTDILENFKEKYKVELSEGNVRSFSGIHEIFIEINEQLMKSGCMALRDDYIAFDTLPGDPEFKGKLHLVGNKIQLCTFVIQQIIPEPFG